ncbi:MAG: hypothetical protein H0U65_13100 [Rubrobacter sp.]|jgi:histidinol-phosphatase (PHP family)|nr:hypothetical protein [Rubrobacter sp.]
MDAVLSSLEEWILRNARERFGEVDVHKMLGVWCVVRTNLEFWRTRRNPSVTYTPVEFEPRARLRDTVRYGPIGKPPRKIVGFDVRGPDRPSRFLWRGAGLMRPITSEWFLLGHDEEYVEWAATHFSKTPFTDAGMDVYARKPHISEGKSRRSSPE